MEGEDVLDQPDGLRGAQAGAVPDVLEEPRFDVHRVSVHPSRAFLKFLPEIGQIGDVRPVGRGAHRRWSAGTPWGPVTTPEWSGERENPAIPTRRVGDVLSW
ncbi:hypothetical protein GCM10009788_09820 [Nocardioides humi]|uniref:Uncharacterized protein n=1 Tax=Nocardioides humi TaxID=449461 RepID=A0ABN2A086_9ACTN